MPDQLVLAVVSALVTALVTVGGVVVALTRYAKRNGNPHSGCRFSKSELAGVLEPLRVSLQNIEKNQAVILVTMQNIGEP